MNRRTAKEQVEVIDWAVVGQLDLPSKYVRRSGVPLCQSHKGELSCTRASGHREAGRDHPSHQHVHAPAPDYIVKEVW